MAPTALRRPRFGCRRRNAPSPGALMTSRFSSVPAATSTFNEDVQCGLRVKGARRAFAGGPVHLARSECALHVGAALAHQPPKGGRDVRILEERGRCIERASVDR